MSNKEPFLIDPCPHHHLDCGCYYEELDLNTGSLLNDTVRIIDTAPNEIIFTTPKKENFNMPDMSESMWKREIVQNEYWAIRLGAKLTRDGDQWCCLYGPNTQEGICGFGDTPLAAIEDFEHDMTNPIKKNVDGLESPDIRECTCCNKEETK